MSLTRLRERGYTASDVEDAFDAVDRSDHLAPPYRDLAHLDVPLPARSGEPPGPSPRAAALLLRALDLEADTSLLVVGPGNGYLEALAREVVDSTVDRTDDRDAISGTWDRILWLPETGEVPDVLDHLRDLGALLVRRRTDEGLEVVKVVKAGEQTAEMTLTDAQVVESPYGDPGETRPAEPDLGKLLELDASLRRVWSANHLLRRERAWARSVQELWRPDPVGDADHDAWTLARRLFHLAFILQMHGDLDTAAEVYTASVETAPSAEAYTFRGWTRSFQGDVDEAIEDCRRAIDVDPSLGNPYNDIGCYLLDLGDLDEAETWFERAAEADRYAAPHYPHLNLARLHLKRGDRDKALEAARESQRIEPEDPATKELLRKLEEEPGSSEEPDQ